MKNKNRSFDTLAVAPVEGEHFPLGAVAEPIFQTSTFVFKDSAEVVKYQEKKIKKYFYTRYENPTLDVAEKKMATLEGGEAGLVVSSGMASISTAVLTLCKSGDEIISTQPLYGGTITLFQKFLPNFGIKAFFVDPLDLKLAQSLINKKTKLFFVETPTNPNLKIADIRKIIALSKKNKLTSVFDNTFATPYNQKPILLGADVVLHSATKYLGGHSDLVAGVIIGKKKFIDQVRETMKVLGGCLDPLGAFLLLRGLKTLAIRMERHNQNGMKIAKFLSEHPQVKKVFYPGLPSHPQYSLAKSQMKGFGGMVCFDVGDLRKATKIMDNLKIFLNAVSLGGVESLASIPVLTSHYRNSKEDLKKADVTGGLIRLSCGIEDGDDLVEDLKQALGKLR
jgi:cystathionine beta-lyase/cystathionine gamma-synthase